MEYIVGEDLESLAAREGRVAVGTAVDYVLQACVALAQAHRLGVVHRDLKPSSLLLAQTARGPRIRVLDLGGGASFRMGGASGMQTTAGSPAYMAPEQLRDGQRCDPRCDLWALGVILHELISGHLPFEGKSAHALLAAISADPATPLTQHAPDAPEALESVLLRCFEKRRERRFQDVAELARALAPFCDSDAGRYVAAVERTLGSDPLFDADSAPRPERPTGPARTRRCAGVVAALFTAVFSLVALVATRSVDIADSTSTSGPIDSGVEPAAVKRASKVPTRPASVPSETARSAVIPTAPAPSAPRAMPAQRVSPRQPPPTEAPAPVAPPSGRSPSVAPPAIAVQRDFGD